MLVMCLPVLGVRVSSMHKKEPPVSVIIATRCPPYGCLLALLFSTLYRNPFAKLGVPDT